MRTFTEIMPPLLLTTRQAAKALSISERTLWQLAKDGKIPTVRIGRSVRFDPRDLQDWISAHKEGGGHEQQ
jgi:excisionase family DNA binding protein